MPVPTLDLLAEMIAALSPPAVTIRSASGEDVEGLKRLVELASANSPMH